MTGCQTWIYSSLVVAARTKWQMMKTAVRARPLSILTSRPAAARAGESTPRPAEQWDCETGQGRPQCRPQKAPPLRTGAGARCHTAETAAAPRDSSRERRPKNRDVAAGPRTQREGSLEGLRTEQPQESRGTEAERRGIRAAAAQAPPGIQGTGAALRGIQGTGAVPQDMLPGRAEVHPETGAALRGKEAEHQGRAAALQGKEAALQGTAAALRETAAALRGTAAALRGTAVALPETAAAETEAALQETAAALQGTAAARLGTAAGIPAVAADPEMREQEHLESPRPVVAVGRKHRDSLRFAAKQERLADHRSFERARVGLLGKVH